MIVNLEYKKNDLTLTAKSAAKIKNNYELLMVNDDFFLMC
jgi:hypothetical protein